MLLIIIGLKTNYLVTTISTQFNLMETGIDQERKNKISYHSRNI